MKINSLRLVKQSTETHSIYPRDIRRLMQINFI